MGGRKYKSEDGKIILPYARSISRIEGSKLQAREFISGKTRTAFQERLLAQLRVACGARGVIIHSALVREIMPPPEIASLISQREQADRKRRSEKPAPG